MNQTNNDFDKLHPKERGLIRRLRQKRYEYGEIVIEMRSGVPVRVAQERTYEKVDDVPGDEFDRFEAE